MKPVAAIALAVLLSASAPADAGKRADRYFTIKPFEKDGKVYRRVGAGVFGKYWISGGSFWAKKRWWPLRFVTGRDDKSLKDYVATTKLLEGIHVAMLGGFLTLNAVALAHGHDLRAAVTSSGIDALANLYPIMSLRLGRARAENLLERKQKTTRAE